MKPEQCAVLLSEDISQNNGFLIGLSIRELLILEGLNPTEAAARQHIKKLIKNTFREIGVIGQPDDVGKIIGYLEDNYNLLSLTDNQIIDEIISFIERSGEGKEPNYAGDPGKVSKYFVGKSDAERRAEQERRQKRRDERLDNII
jgi:hypothetical protein